MADAAVKYGDGPTRQAHKHKDPRGYAHFVQMLSEHSPLGHALTMLNLQAKRPTLWDMQAELKSVRAAAADRRRRRGRLVPRRQRVPHRTAPTAGLVVVPRAGHTLTSEEPEKFNAALDEFFAEAERGTWLSHKPRRNSVIVSFKESDMDLQLKGKTALVTGGSEGIGKGIALRARQGRRRRRDLRAPQGAAGSSGRRDRQGDRPQDRRRSRPTCARTPTPRTSSSRATRRSAASTSWSTTPAPRPAA